MQIFVISVALLASVAACSVNLFSAELNQTKPEQVWPSEVSYVDAGVPHSNNGEPK